MHTLSVCLYAKKIIYQDFSMECYIIHTMHGLQFLTVLPCRLPNSLLFFYLYAIFLQHQPALILHLPLQPLDWFETFPLPVLPRFPPSPRIADRTAFVPTPCATSSKSFPHTPVKARPHFLWLRRDLPDASAWLLQKSDSAQADKIIHHSFFSLHYLLRYAKM